VEIENTIQCFSELDMWLSDDSTNEIFSSSNVITMEVIFSEMRRLGFSGKNEVLMHELFRLTVEAARLFREFIVYYIVDKIDWEPREQVEIEAPELSQVTLPLIVAE
jgi:hypothetical protein